MSGPRPAIVVTLPARSADAARAEIAAVARSGADLVEIRLDRWPASARPELRSLLPSAIPLLATLRSRAEGGEGPDDPEARREPLRAAAGSGIRWLDLEWDRDRSVVADLPPPDRVGRLFSAHLPSSAPRAAWERRIEELSACGGLAKLVGPLGVRELIEGVLPLLSSRAGPNLTVHTTGASGPLLRGLAAQLRFPLVYCSADPPIPSIEPSQLPIGTLRPFLAADGRPPVFAVAGRPVAHSRSPEIHRRWMDRDRRTGLYLALEFGDEAEFVACLDGLAELGVVGMNVTQPFKVAARAAATRASPGVDACGAANCLTLRDGSIDAENTDLVAIDRRLGELREEGRWDGRALAVVGAGGAARATLAAARLRGADASVFARRPEEARGLGREFGAATPNRPGGPASLLVHATTAGRAGRGPPEGIFRELLGPGTHVLDWVYAPDPPVVAEAAKEAGASYEDGWRLLVYQAAASYALWWGSEPPADGVAELLQEGGCAV